MKIAEKMEWLNKLSQKQWVKNTKGEPKDYSARFKLIGGPYHGNLVRLYAPWDDLTFPDGSCYTLTAPLGKNDKWVYVHTTTTGGTE